MGTTTYHVRGTVKMEGSFLVRAATAEEAQYSVEALLDSTTWPRLESWLDADHRLTMPVEPEIGVAVQKNTPLTEAEDPKPAPCSKCGRELTEVLGYVPMVPERKPAPPLTRTAQGHRLERRW